MANSFNWDTYEEVPKEANSFDWDKFEEVKPSVSKTESFIRGAGEMASLGLGDEFSAAVTNPMGAAKQIGNLLGASFKDEDIDAYIAQRDANRKAQDEASVANPNTSLAGNILGGIATSVIPGASTLKGAVVTGAGLGLGSSKSEDLGGLLMDAEVGAAGGALGYGIADVGSKIVGAGIKKATPYVKNAGDSLKKVGGYIAENATGGTGRQAAGYVPNTGVEMLEAGLVGYGDDAASILKKVTARHNQAGAAIGDALETLEKRGVTGSVDNVVNVLESQIDDLSRTPGNEKLIKQLQGEIDNLYNRGQSDLGFKGIEEAKRTFQGQTNYASPEFEKKASTKIAKAFKDEAERAAIAADPSIAKKFLEEKKMYALLAPVKEASEKRALNLQQQQFGNFLDIGAGLYGISNSDTNYGKAALAIAGRRLVSPRIASTAAKGIFDVGSIATNLAERLAQNPQSFGRFGKALQEAAKRSPHSLAVAHYLLQQKDEEYRNTIKGLEEN